MFLPVNPVKVLRLFAPLWALLALSVAVHWESWQSKPILLAAIALLPFAAAFAAGLIRERWRLELTPDALVHHTLGRSERFDWARMGPLEMKRAPISDLLFLRTFWFVYPLDTPRSIENAAPSSSDGECSVCSAITRRRKPLGRSRLGARFMRRVET